MRSPINIIKHKMIPCGYYSRKGSFILNRY